MHVTLQDVEARLRQVDVLIGSLLADYKSGVMEPDAVRAMRAFAARHLVPTTDLNKAITEILTKLPTYEIALSDGTVLNVLHVPKP